VPQRNQPERFRFRRNSLDKATCRVNATDEFTDRDMAAIAGSTLQVGREIFDRLPRRQPTILERQWWDDRIMDWAMRDESVKVQMFRFVDVLPMLTTSKDVVQHLQEYFDEVRSALPSAVRLGMAMAKPGSVLGRAVALAARRNAASQARRFIAGTDAREVLKAAKRERALRRAFTLDVLGEAVTNDVEADRYLEAYKSLIENVAPTVNSWSEEPQIDRAGVERIPRANVSIKLSALDSHFDPIDPAGATERVGERLRLLLRVAREHGAFVNVDMESYGVKDLTLHVFKTVLMEEEFRGTRDVGIVFQCYLKDAERDLVDLRDWAKKRGAPVWVRLVKGAYWDYETTSAEAAGWPVPVFTQKWRSDANYERQTRYVMRNHEYLRPALGSHNIRSLAHGIATARHLGMAPGTFEIQMLYGMADAEKQAFVDMGHRLRVYMPYGELIPGMAYLVRRLLENTSNDSFLRASFAEQRPIEELLADPLEQGAHLPPSGAGLDTDEDSTMTTSSMKVIAPASASAEAIAFRNEPPTDFAIAKHRDAMQQALAEVRSHLGRHYPVWIGDGPIETLTQITSTNPSRDGQVVGTTGSGTAEHIGVAVRAAKAALPAWSGFGAEGRAKYLRAAAASMRRRRFDLSAWIVLESGKPWREADGDVAEAIDFLEYYAAGAIAMEQAHGVDVAGEENRFEYLPRGVVGVIAPWNFPLAILTGMTAAALATGNTVIMKPAEQTPVIAAKLMAIFAELDLPAGVLNYVPGEGHIAGAALVDHPDVALIVFTGSREVGLKINARAAEISTKNATHVKRVIAEMGGKNAIVVDTDADLDEAVVAVAKSAFGYSGQKCSACSRCIVLAPVYDVFLSRLVETTRSMVFGSAEEPATQIGPVIDEEALARVQKYIEIGKSEGRVALAVEAGPLAAQGEFVGPHIFADVSPDARIAQEEIFGPVLAVIRANDLDDALRIANGTDYALTAGIFSRSPANLDRARRELLAGNLYLNRGITGALVCRQPFGGFKMSGIGSKAGGADYLTQFVVPRTITENTMRRGFAPRAEDRGE
jgi:RHH-type proline utilization regulon transcriptional repressor/proline dehydrogenase/delta 1-pyrroline-5-carboxylate dehydrogenase